ncbi:MAG: MBL fold metallo-hydrolase, partial [Planctomycetota bacterium]
MTERPQVVGHSVGAMRVHVVEDAPFKIDAGTMFGMVPRTRWEPLVQLDGEHRVEVTTWCLVVECPDALVLVETGFGTKLSDQLCRFYDWSNDYTVVDRLDELGFASERFTHVVLTHMHLDHAGG